MINRMRDLRLLGKKISYQGAKSRKTYAPPSMIGILRNALRKWL